jgi:hypothetical protein
MILRITVNTGAGNVMLTIDKKLKINKFAYNYPGILKHDTS